MKTHRVWATAFAVLALFVSTSNAAAPELLVRRAESGGFDLSVRLQRDDGVTTETFLGRSFASTVAPREAGEAPGAFSWLTWSEDGLLRASWTEDGGVTWSAPRTFEVGLHLDAGTVQPGEAMPPPAFRSEGDARLFLVQARLPWSNGMRGLVRDAGCTPRAYVPENAWIVRCRSVESAFGLRALSFVERVEPFECAYRLSNRVAAWLGSADAESPDVRRVRAVTLAPADKAALVAAARGLGAETGFEESEGSLLDLTVTRAQLKKIACLDTVQYVDAWTPSRSLMDLVRADTGADWLEDPLNGPYCGTGVKVEVLDDLGFDLDHQEFAGRVEPHGASVPLHAHGTGCVGVLISSGSVEPRSRGLMPCATAVAADAIPIVDGLTDRFELTRESRDVYEVSFQTNSWSLNLDPGDYDAISYEMDEIAWRLDFTLLQAAGNSGKDARPNMVSEAFAKNAITVGGAHHYDTADLSDDFWCDKNCQTEYSGDPAGCDADPKCVQLGPLCYDTFSCPSNGPTGDGRTKPDLAGWYDSIFTTGTNNDTGEDTYGNFSGTSAATPQVGGALGLILEMWADTSDGGANRWGRSPAGATVFEKQPHSATMKALLVNSAEPYAFSGAGQDLGRDQQGWGRANVRNAAGHAGRSFVVDEDDILVAGQKATYTLEVAPGEARLRATLSWLDPPKPPAAAGRDLLDDLDLRVVSPPDGNGDVDVYCGNAGLDLGNVSSPAWSGPPPAPDCDDPALSGIRDTLNNLENVWIEEAAPGAGVRSGTWTVDVKAVEVDADANVVEACRDIDLDPNDPEAGRAACEAASCSWDGTLGLCSDGTFDVAFGLVVSGATEAGASALPGVAETLTVSRNGDGTLQLTWTPDCGAGTLYAVYRGDLSLGYDSIAPEPGQCAVGGTTVTVPEGPGTTDFFLVVPSNGADEGSYGKTSAGDDRAPATAACHPQGATDACAQ